MKLQELLDKNPQLKNLIVDGFGENNNPNHKTDEYRFKFDCYSFRMIDTNLKTD